MKIDIYMDTVSYMKVQLREWKASKEMKISEEQATVGEVLQVDIIDLLIQV